MLTQLATVKARLGILDTDTANDLLLTHAIQALSARFDHECNRTLARTVDAMFEFSAEDTELVVPCYPIESVTRFELKISESAGWVEQAGIEYLIGNRCVISLARFLGFPGSAFPAMARVVYTGGYVLPGNQVGEGQTLLPRDLEMAATEQTTYWFQNRERLGLERIWDYHATYRQFGELDLLPNVRAILGHYTRWNA